jgi:hypothetical protein
MFKIGDRVVYKPNPRSEVGTIVEVADGFVFVCHRINWDSPTTNPIRTYPPNLGYEEEFYSPLAKALREEE